MSALSKFHSTRLSIQELLSGRIRLQRYGLFLKLKHLYPNKINADKFYFSNTAAKKQYLVECSERIVRDNPKS